MEICHFIVGANWIDKQRMSIEYTTYSFVLCSECVVCALCLLVSSCVFLCEKCENAKSYLFGATGLWCLSSLATVTGNTEYNNLQIESDKTRKEKRERDKDRRRENIIRNLFERRCGGNWQMSSLRFASCAPPSRWHWAMYKMTKSILLFTDRFSVFRFPIRDTFAVIYRSTLPSFASIYSRPRIFRIKEPNLVSHHESVRRIYGVLFCSLSGAEIWFVCLRPTSAPFVTTCGRCVCRVWIWFFGWAKEDSARQDIKRKRQKSRK